MRLSNSLNRFLKLPSLRMDDAQENIAPIFAFVEIQHSPTLLGRVRLTACS